MTVSPVLDPVDSIVQDLAVEEITAGQALARIRAAGGTPACTALLDAVQLLRLRDRFLDRLGDPYDYTGVHPDALTSVDVWQLAVDKAETEYSYALLALVKPARPMVGRAS